MKTEVPIPEKPKKNRTNYNYSEYARYSSLAIEMIVVIILGVFGGKYLDTCLSFHFPIFTLLLSLLSVGLAMYLAIRDVINPKKK
jgi:hypothetical protein